MIIEKVNIVRTLKSGVFTLEMGDDGVLRLHVSGDKEINLAGYQEMVKRIGEISDGKPVPVFASGDEFMIPDEDVRKLMTRSDSNPYSIASAILVKSISQRLIGNFFVKVMKPERPFRIFTNEEEALEWLKTFL